MAQAEIKAVITAEDRASKVIDKFGVKTIAVGVAIGNAIGNVAVRAMDALKSQIGDAIKRVDTLKNANRTFENMGFQAGQVKSAMEGLKDSILGLPTPLDDAVRGMTLISSATNDVGKSQKIFTAMNDAILGFGGNSEMVSNAVVQLSQDLAGGRIQAQTWNSMLNSGLGPTLAAIARKMNISTAALKEGLSKGDISVQQFTDSLIELDEKGGGGLKSLKQIAKDSTNGIQTSMDNAKTAVVRALAKIIDAIGQENIANAIKRIGTTLEEFITKFAVWVDTHREDIRNVFTVLGETLMFVGRVLANLATFIINNKDIFLPIIAGITGVILAYKTMELIMTATSIIRAIIALGSTITSFAVSAVGQFGAVGAAKIALDAVISTPMVLALSIGAALALIAYAYMKVEELKGAIEGANRAAKAADETYDKMVKNARQKYAEGKISKERLNALTQGRATGGSVMPGQPYMVGEQGPEMFVPTGSGRIVPNSQMGGASNTVFNIAPSIGIYAGTPMERRKLAETILQDLKDVANGKGIDLMGLIAR